MKSWFPFRTRRILLVSLSLFFVLARSNRGLPSPQSTRPPFPSSGTVVFVYDGDTIKVRFADGVGRRVRLIGVDTPEADDAREEVALWAQLARRFTLFHLSGRRVSLTFDFEPLDKYGRVLAFVWTEDGALFNELIVRQGFAHAYLSYPFRRDYQERFKEAEKEARTQGRGLWAKEEPDPLSPDKARPNLGEFASVRFIPAEISESRYFIYLSSRGSAFEALIPQKRRQLFPAAESLRGKELVVSGFLEEFKGRLQIILFYPRQLSIRVD